MTLNVYGASETKPPTRLVDLFKAMLPQRHDSTPTLVNNSTLPSLLNTGERFIYSPKLY